MSRQRIDWQYEILDYVDNGKDGFAKSTRVMVYGGWIVHHYTSYKHNISESMIFVPDKDHVWSIAKPIEEKPQPNKLDAASFKTTSTNA